MGFFPHFSPSLYTYSDVDDKMIHAIVNMWISLAKPVEFPSVLCYDNVAQKSVDKWFVTPFYPHFVDNVVDNSPILSIPLPLTWPIIHMAAKCGCLNRIHSLSSWG